MKRQPIARSRTLAAATGIVLDRLFEEPSNSVHPVAYFGRAMNDFEQRHYRDDKLRGGFHTARGVMLALAAARILRSTAVATGLAIGGSALHRAANDVSDALDRGDIERARSLLRTLAGRDASDLDEFEIARAAIESVAENTVDAIVAPALFGAVAGAAGALGYRAINTMDAMVGHRSPRYVNYGWASARLDDIANWVPARCTAALVTIVRPRFKREIWIAVTEQAPSHPSPNSGVVEAAFAAALGLQLGGRNIYQKRIEDRPALGSGRSATSSDIFRAVQLSRDVTTLLAVVLGLIGVALWRQSR
jgi:adenosylcobinamide-phosphate synthase